MFSQPSDFAHTPSRAVIHCDVDCFYCQVETLDNPALVGRPLAVHQGNSGGFVAVNYEAKAFGVRCGDGSDPGNLAARTFQQDRPHDNCSLPEVRQMCPGLITKPMRSDRYRQVSAQLLALLSTFAANGQCEKTSYDDFYLEVHSSSSDAAALQDCRQSAGEAVHVVGDASLATLPVILQQAVQVVGSIRAAVQKELGFSMSFGIAEGKLAARLAGPLHKPSGITVVPPQHAARFLLQTPILKVPLLRGQLGKQVVEQLLVEKVQDLAAYDSRTLVDMFGESTGQLLYDLGHAIDNKRVQTKGPQQSIACTKSYHGLREMARVDEALHRLIFALWPRLLEERSKSGRIPAKLKLSCKQGGREQAVRSHTLPFPHAASKQLSAIALGSVDASLVASAAVHTLIPNMAPRSRFTHTAAAAAAAGSSAQASGQSHASCDGVPGGQSVDGQAGVAEWDEESGPHQEARQALFDAAMHVLRPKLAQPVLVNFLSVAGDYVKDIYQTQQKSANSMLRFLHAPQPRNAPSRQSDVGANAMADNSQTLPKEGQIQDIDRTLKLQHEVECKQGPRKQSSDVYASSALQSSKRQKKGPLDSFFTKR